MIKEFIIQENLILNIYTSKNEGPTYMKQNHI